MLFEMHNAPLFLSRGGLKRKRGLGHLLLFFRNPCRGRNLLNNNVTFIQWYMTFKNKGRRRVQPCSVAQIQNTEFELNVTPFGFCFLYAFCCNYIFRPPCPVPANPFLDLYDFSTQTKSKNIKTKNHNSYCYCTLFDYTEWS